MQYMNHVKFKPSTDLWVCPHEYAYPDVCPCCPMPPKNNIRQLVFWAVIMLLMLLGVIGMAVCIDSVFAVRSVMIL